MNAFNKPLAPTIAAWLPSTTATVGSTATKGAALALGITNTAANANTRLPFINNDFIGSSISQTGPYCIYTIIH